MGISGEQFLLSGDATGDAFKSQQGVRIIPRQTFQERGDDEIVGGERDATLTQR